jgi:glutathione S-transferase
MASLTLVIGNKTYSSWSLRPWLLLRQGGVPFDEVRVPLYAADSRARILEHSPAGKVPVLLDGSVRVWDSLAICEYAAERFPDRCGWPADAAARAVARSVAAEMHAGFVSLRAELPMNCRARRVGVEPSAAARADVERVVALLEACRAQFGASGPFLFGAFSPADAFFAPVALRFATYGVALPPAAASWSEAVRGLPAVEAWIADARREAEVLDRFERGREAA